jgi:hypothetical protein
MNGTRGCEAEQSTGCAWKDADWNVTLGYRPVHLTALSNEAPSFPPAERTH